MTNAPRLILGIDPGLVATGLGLITFGGEEPPRLVETGTLRTRSGDPLAWRLSVLYDAAREFAERHRPDCVAVEKIFFARNVASAVALAHARAAVIVAAAASGIEVFEYAPLEIKQAVAGFGRAGKDQVRRMIRVLLRMTDDPSSEHVADALACAWCHGARVSRTLHARPDRSRGPDAAEDETNSAKALLALMRRGRRRPGRH